MVKRTFRVTLGGGLMKIDDFKILVKSAIKSEIWERGGREAAEERCIPRKARC